MPFAEVTLIPGVNIESTAADNPSGISESNFIRFKANLVEKRGGSSLLINERMSGIPVDIQPWGDVSGKACVATATTEQVYAYQQDTSYNRIISPQILRRPNVSVNLSSTAGSNLITITDSTIQNLTTYDSVTFNTIVYIGGLVLLNTYPIVEAQGVSSYVIDAGYPATTTETNAGTLPEFVVNAGSSEIFVNFPTQYQFGQLAVGDRIGFVTPTVVGNVTIEGQYIVNRIISPTRFTIIDDQTATTPANVFLNNGFLDLTYWIVEGPLLFGSGFGTNAYGEDGYGTGTPNPTTTGNPYTASDWYLDNRGSALIASAANGPIFYWNSTNGYKNLSIVENAPVRSAGAFVSMPYGNIMAWGTSEVINPLQDPLQIRWSDSKDISNWSIQGNSDAGFYNIPTGSKIVRGIQGPTQQFWFTDADVYSAQYIGYPGTYSFNKIGNGCGLVAPKSVGVLGSNVFWMSNRQFFVCPSGSAPQPMPCSVWDFVFQNMDTPYMDKVICGTNSLFNEVMWFFPTQDAPFGRGIPNAYVSYNAQYSLWDTGFLNRTAWYDQSLIGPPISADSNGYVYQQETSNNNASGSTTDPIDSWFQTGYYSITEGQDLSFVDWVLPDFTWGQYNQPKNADLYIYFYVTDYAGQTPRTYGPYLFNKDTKFISPRMRGRYIAFRIGSNDLDSFWRIGSIRYRFAPSGRR